MDKQKLKQAVHAYWNKASCGTEVAQSPKHSYDYFQEIEAFRYKIEPEIFAFAQFTRFHGKKVLEVGVGAGTDFLQWARAGAECYGVDLTEESIANVQQRLALYGLKAHDLRVADAQQLPYQSDSFDLVYSWGVIHHAPDMEKCLQEIIRVAKPGSTIKIMIYNRRSLFAYYQYIRNALLKGKPFRSISSVLFYHQESLGTKAYTFSEIRTMLKKYPVSITHLAAHVTQHDLLYYRFFARACAYVGACVLGWQKAGWFMTIELQKHGQDAL